LSLIKIGAQHGGVIQPARTPKPDRFLLKMVLFYLLLTAAGFTLHFLSIPSPRSVNPSSDNRGRSPQSIVTDSGIGRSDACVPSTNTGEETLKP
jgi:hypothetical protein